MAELQRTRALERAVGRLFLVLALGIGLLALVVAPAGAALSHSTVEKEFTAGPECPRVNDIVVLESAELIYVVCDGIPLPPGGTFGATAAIKRFDFQGNPVNFTANKPYVSGNAITASPSNPIGRLGSPRIAVDNSGAHNGNLYLVAGSGTSGGPAGVDVFGMSGEWLTVISPVGLFAPTMTDVDVGDDGSVYTIQAGENAPHITRYDTTFDEVERIYTLVNGGYVRIDSSGGAWARIAFSSGSAKISRYEEDQFTTFLKAGFGSSPSLIESLRATTSPLFPDPLLQGTDVRNFDLDPVNDDLYVSRGGRIEVYSTGTAEEAPHQNAPSFGSGVLSNTEAVAVTSDHRVFATSGNNKVVRFGPGDVLPDITTPKPTVDDVGHISAIVRASIDPAGGSAITSCQVQYGKNTTYSGAGSGVAPCSPDPSGGSFAVTTEVSATLPGLNTGETYHYRFKAGNVKGTNTGIDRTVTPAYVLKVKTLAATDVSDHGAQLQGSFDPDGAETSFHFEYGVDTNYGLSTPDAAGGEAPGVTSVEAELTSLPAGKVWHYRIVASNDDGTTVGEDRVFKTAGAPDVSGLRSTEVAASSATLRARIDPVGYDTAYRFEYGTTPAYGQQAPIADGQLGGEGGSGEVSEQIAGLTPGITYHYRVVASNKWGTSASPDTTFDFAPPSCPNDHVRQQTGSSYLPDCRAYELVSPASAGGVRLWPSQVAWDSFGSGAYGQGDVWPVNHGFASSPARFAFFANSGVITGIDAPNTRLDMYMASRTNSSWVTTLPGLRSSEAWAVDRKECSESMALCVDHKLGGFGTGGPQFAPYLFTADGKSLDQLPSNVKTIPDGAHFTGAQRMSGDFSHFFFSSTDVVFAPGGIGSGLGSAYDNDLGSRSVTIASKLPDGSDIPSDGPASTAIEFPGLSPDGSHVLMQTPAANGQSHLYMRVDQSVSYDIDKGSGVTFVGMTRDGSKVFFTSAEQLSDADDDSSIDLYMWSEQVDALTPISNGNGNGNVDDCNATWTDGCGVAPLSLDRGKPDGNPSVAGLDDALAEGTGDVYFYSPEQLDAQRPGIPNQRNLYLYRDGGVQLVASFDPKTQVNRMQISPDGSHAAILTESRLTSYDNKGYAQIYTYDATTGGIRCASCNPSGLPPSADVAASQGGRFMADDGRAFFATSDSLVRRDTNGSIIDVYEYVGGRPQLISSGFAARDFTGGSNLSSLPGSGDQYTGLEAVSRDGRDVYFSTFDTLVSQDRNGERVKLYDARTGGGFATPPELPLCAAADECHGPDSSAPSAPTIASGGNLGAGGNVVIPRQSKPSKAKAKKKAKRKSKRQRRRNRHD